jgi:hypothetical protein
VAVGEGVRGGEAFGGAAWRRKGHLVGGRESEGREGGKGPQR